MTTSVLGDDRYTVPFILLAQGTMTIAIAAVCGLWLGGIVGLSILLGGLAVIVPNAFFAARILNADIDSLMRSAWIGEIGKILLTVLMCFATFAFVRPISAPAVVGGLIAAQFMILPAAFIWQRFFTSAAAIR